MSLYFKTLTEELDKICEAEEFPADEEIENDDDLFSELSDSEQDDILNELIEITDNFSKPSGSITVYDETTKYFVIGKLREHYAIVEASDGRTHYQDTMNYVITYDDKF